MVTDFTIIFNQTSYTVAVDHSLALESLAVEHPFPGIGGTCLSNIVGQFTYIMSSRIH